MVQDDIEVLNWIDKVSIRLPMPMYSFAPTISNDHLTIVGYTGTDLEGHRNAYQMPVTNITASAETTHVHNKFIKCNKQTELTAATHLYTALVPTLYPLGYLIGGEDQSDITAGIEIYDNSKRICNK